MAATKQETGATKTAPVTPAPKKDVRTALNPDLLKRKTVQERKPVKEVKEPPPVAQGTVDRVTDYAFNATREKIREVTVIDFMQARLLPQLDVVISLFHYVVQVAMYRQDPKQYEEEFEEEAPKQPDILEEFVYRIAQWQKSEKGKNLQSAMDIALAQIESQQEDDMGGAGGDPWKDD